MLFYFIKNVWALTSQNIYHKIYCGRRYFPPLEVWRVPPKPNQIYLDLYMWYSQLFFNLGIDKIYIVTEPSSLELDSVLTTSIIYLFEP